MRIQYNSINFFAESYWNACSLLSTVDTVIYNNFFKWGLYPMKISVDAIKKDIVNSLQLVKI